MRAVVRKIAISIIAVILISCLSVIGVSAADGDGSMGGYNGAGKGTTGFGTGSWSGNWQGYRMYVIDKKIKGIVSPVRDVVYFNPSQGTYSVPNTSGMYNNGAGNLQLPFELLGSKTAVGGGTAATVQRVEECQVLSGMPKAVGSNNELNGSALKAYMMKAEKGEDGKEVRHMKYVVTGFIMAGKTDKQKEEVWNGIADGKYKVIIEATYMVFMSNDFASATKYDINISTSKNEWTPYMVAGYKPHDFLIYGTVSEINAEYKRAAGVTNYRSPAVVLNLRKQFMQPLQDSAIFVRYKKSESGAIIRESLKDNPAIANFSFANGLYDVYGHTLSQELTGLGANAGNLSSLVLNVMGTAMLLDKADADLGFSKPAGIPTGDVGTYERFANPLSGYGIHIYEAKVESAAPKLD